MSRGSHIVIGAGIVGIALARALQRSGRQVTVIDGGLPGRGTSFGNAGYLAVDQVLPLARPSILMRAPGMLVDPLGPLTIHWPSLPALLPWMLRFAWSARPTEVRRGIAALSCLMETAQQTWMSEIEASGLGDLFQSKGALYVYEDLAAYHNGTKERNLQRQLGTNLVTLSGDEARDRAPGLSRNICAGVYYPDGMHTVNPFRLVTALTTRFAAEGGKVLQEMATGFDLRDGHVRQVLTVSSALQAETVTIAAGRASSELTRMLGFSAPLIAERGYHVMMDASNVSFDLPVCPSERGFFITPMECGLRLAGTVEISAPNRPPSWGRAEILKRHLREIFPEIEAIESSRWVGERPTLPDYRPAIGRAPRLGNVYCAYGHQHVGLTLATATARILTDLMSGGTLPAVLTSCDPGRFG